MTDWMEIVVTDAGDQASDVAAAVAPNGAQLRGAEVVRWVPAEDAEDALAEARGIVAAFGIGPASVRAQPAVPESEWREAWKRYFKVERLTRRIVVVPSWERYTPREGDVVLDLDPGQAFGTGAHASTQLCLEALDQLAAPGTRAPVQRWLDLGTGSGILSIAAAKLWPHASGLAVDIDPLAVDAARDNCARNGVGDRVVCTGAPIDAVDERFALVLANIQAVVHLALRDAIAATVAPGGLLVLSGLLTGEVAEVTASYADAGMITERTVQSTRDGQWSAAYLRSCP